MTRRRRRVPALAAAVAAAVVAAAAPASPAAADVAGPYFAHASNVNRSDPHIIQCTDPDTNTNGYCLYTSEDMGQSYAYPGNSYPMRYTKGYFSANGYSNWVDKGTVFSEQTLINAGWVPSGAYHLWAPAVAKRGNNYYLYVPDVSDISNDAAPNIHTSSRIAVAVSTDPFGPFTYQGYVPYNGYMSDPDVLVDGQTAYLVWADGDNGNCGGLKINELASDMRTINPNTSTSITISGIGVLGNCGGTGRPYLEGASLYKFGESSMPGPYTLVFAAKPTSVPTECTPQWAGTGNANTAWEVIAYATATNPRGPYTYQGIIMCGSTTEWTNQATIMKITNGNGSKPWVIVYHDSAANIKQRKLHAECLFAGDGKIAGVYRQPLNAPNGFNFCVNGNNFDFSAYHVTQPWSAHVPALMSAANGGNDYLKLNRMAVGPWERFREVKLANGNYAYLSLANGKYICYETAGVYHYLKAMCSSSSTSTAQFVKVAASGGFKLKSAAAAAGYGYVFVTQIDNIAGNWGLYADLTPTYQEPYAAVFSERHLR